MDDVFDALDHDRNGLLKVSCGMASWDERDVCWVRAAGSRVRGAEEWLQHLVGVARVPCEGSLLRVQ